MGVGGWRNGVGVAGQSDLDGRGRVEDMVEVGGWSMTLECEGSVMGK